MAARRECWFDNRKSIHSLTEKNFFFVSQLWWSCTQEDWSKEKQVCEKFVVTIPPGGCVYFWQYTLGIGNEDVLHTKYVIMTDTETAPTNVPLPSLQVKQNNFETLCMNYVVWIVLIITCTMCTLSFVVYLLKYVGIISVCYAVQCRNV